MTAEDHRRRLLQVISPVAVFGEHVSFYVRSYRSTVTAAVRYRREVLRLLAEVSLGSGVLATIGGTVIIVAALNLAAGAEIGILGFTALKDIGLEPLTGFTSAYISTREVAPFVSIFALVATIGAGFTAQLGAMRVSEEIDALEVMAVQSVPYLVSTRIVAGGVAVVPIYLVALFTSYGATKGMVTLFFGQAAGTYQHYFSSFLYPIDLLLSTIKVMVMTLALMAVQCYYGFRTTGGPAGVGRAVGNGVRSALIVALFVDLVCDMFFYGGPPSVRVSG